MDKLKDLVMTVAPALGTALGGPLGGAAISILAEALGLEKDSDAEQVRAAMKSTDPEVLKASMARAEAAFKAAAEETITVRQQIISHVEMMQLDYARGAFHSLWRPFAGWIAVFYAGGSVFLTGYMAFNGDYTLLNMAAQQLMIGGPIMALAGVYAWGKSNERVAVANSAPPSILDTVKGMLNRR